MVTAEKRRATGGIPDHRALEEQQAITREIIRRMLVQFHREWTDLAESESGASWVLAATALLDRYSHQLYDAVCDAGATLGEDLAVEIRCLSADMIRTTNILVMFGCGEECRERSEDVVKEAILLVERCLALVQKSGGHGPATRIFATRREE